MMKKIFLILVWATFFIGIFTSCHREHDCTCKTTMLCSYDTVNPPSIDTTYTTIISTIDECSSMNSFVEKTDSNGFFSTKVICK